RVQSVAVRLIVDKELEIEKFKSSVFYRTDAVFDAKGSKMKAKLAKNFDAEKDAKSFVDSCVDHNFKVNSVTKKPAKKSPTAPFTTSTLQQEASLKMGFSVSRTMSVAQRLYEAGHITYMRTDSVNLSKTATDAAQAEIENAYGKEYHNFRQFKNKNSSAQEAHEAIRPTNFAAHSIEGESDQEKLYQLIWKRSIASQMSEAQLERTAIKIDAPNNLEFSANGEIIKFDGFLKVYLESTLDDEDDSDIEGLLPPISEGEVLGNDSVTSTERFTRPPARYVEASLVKKLEELGIGRPSTYAPTISTIQKRGYVEKGEKEGVERKYNQIVLENGSVNSSEQSEKTGSDKGKLVPTDIGRVVTEFLIQHFDQIMDYNFTASVEKEFDDIAQGLVKWTKMLKEFYGPFHLKVEDTIENSERASGERELGVDPKSGKKMIARIGRFGPMVQIGEQDDEDKPKFASIQKDQSISTITLEEALELFKFPKTIGQFEEKDVKINKGRFGPYVQIEKMFVSIKEANGDSLESMTIERAIELILEKREEDKNRIIKEFKENAEMQLLNGRYGAYLKIGKKNFKLPKDVEPADLSYEECIHISENQPKGRKKKK
ncbi:MAG: DNA topoisomerase-1, partial [Arenicella sp.]